jgi:hypothetical protein
MDRRTLLTAGGRFAVAAAYMAAATARAQPGYTVSRARLQKAVTGRFPRNYPVGGLFELTVLAPQLRLLPELNRLGTEMVVQAAGAALERAYTGGFDLDFALRYEAADLSIRAHQLRVNWLRLDGLPPGQSALLDAYGPSLASRALQDVVLHQLSPKDLALPHAMGLQPGSIDVTKYGLVIGFVSKPG